MKLLTLNCHSWQEENQIQKIKTIVDTIKENSYDVIALQEVNQSIKEEVLYNDIKKDNFSYVLIKELEKAGISDYKFTWAFSHLGYEGYEEGLSILTKHNIIEEDEFFASRSIDTNFWKTRKMAGVKILYDNKPIIFYSCHLGWWNDEEEPFKEQVDNIIKRLNNDDLTFLMGDFNNNAFIRGEGYDYLIKNNLYDTYEIAKTKDNGITVKGKIAGWDRNKQDLRLDLILSNKPVDVKSSKVIFNNINKEVVSDHFGVEVELNI